jgi:regulator of sigma E protease
VSWVLAFVGFAALIVLHELGHFAAAKAVGMRVERFALFFPPLLFKRTRGETEYGIGAIPLGGYVKITGMNPNEEVPPEHLERAYYKQKVWKRVVVIAAGPAMNFLIAFLLLWAIFWSNGFTDVTTKVDTVKAGSPAAQVLKPGETIVAVDGKRGGYDVLSKQISTHTCAGTPTKGCVADKPVTLTVQRVVDDGGTLRTVTRDVEATPRYDPTAKRTLLGFSFGQRTVPIGPFDAADRSVTAMGDVAGKTVTSIGKLFYDAQARKEVSGVVGSYEATRQSFDFSTTRALFVLAIISLSLAVVNLFPFLPLDGGHIFWAVAEKVRGRPISYRVMERASVVGFALVVFLFAIGLSNDIGRLNGEGFGVR